MHSEILILVYKYIGGVRCCIKYRVDALCCIYIPMCIPTTESTIRYVDTRVPVRILLRQADELMENNNVCTCIVYTIHIHHFTSIIKYMSYRIVSYRILYMYVYNVLVQVYQENGEWTGSVHVKFRHFHCSTVYTHTQCLMQEMVSDRWVTESNMRDDDDGLVSCVVCVLCVCNTAIKYGCQDVKKKMYERDGSILLKETRAKGFSVRECVEHTKW